MIKEKQDIRKILLAVLSALLLVGCSAKADVAGYVEGAMNARYKADYELYMDVTGCDLESAEKLFKDRLSECMAVIESAELSDELEDEYRSFFDRVLKSVRYSVGNVTEKDDAYHVDVTVEPLNMFHNIADELGIFVDEYYTEVTEDALNGSAIPTESELREEVYKILLEILNNHMNHISYAEPVTVTLRVTQDKNNTILINPVDVQELDQLLIDMESMGLK